MKDLAIFLTESLGLVGDMPLVKKWLKNNRNQRTALAVVAHDCNFRMDEDIMAKLFEWLLEDLDQFDRIPALTAMMNEDGPTNFPEWLEENYNITYDAPWEDVFKALGELMEEEI